MNSNRCTFRESGLAWVESIPAHWRVVPAWSVAKLVRRPPSEGEGIVTAFRDGEVTLRRNRRMDGFTEAVQELGYQGVRAGELVIHSMDGFAGAIGVSDSDGKMSPVVHIYSILNEEPRFVALLLRELARNGVIESLARGIRERSTAFDRASFRSLTLPLPPRVEQREILQFLDRETAQIDAFIAKNEELIALLHERRTAVVDATFARITARLIRLKYVASVQTGITLGGDGDPSDPAWPYLSVANVQVGFLDLANIKRVNLPPERAQRSLLRVGDVLMTEGGDPDKLGRGALWEGSDAPMLHQNHVFAVRTSLQLDPRYLMRWLDASPARRHFESTAKQTTNLASTNKTVVGELKVPLPAVVEQRRITRAIDAKLDLLSNSIGTAKRAIDLARERRAALISAAVTGKIDVGVSA